MKQDFAKKYGEEIGKNTSESVQSMKSYKQDAQKAESAEMKASEVLKQNRSIAGPEKINSMSDLMGIVDQVDQGVEAMTSNNVSYGQEDQLRERYQDASADIRGRVDNNRPLIQEKTENAGPKTPIPEPKTAEELAVARARSGYDTDNLKDADVTRQDAETATEGSDAAAQRAMEEANKSALEGPIPFKERFNASQQKAMTDSEAGLLDVSRYGDVLSGQGGSIAKAVLGAAGYKGLEALSEKGAERHLQNKAADALDPDSKMPDKERSTLRKAMNRVGSAMDSLKEAGGKKIDSFKGLHKGLQEVGDFKKFANNDQVQKAIGRVYGESWLEKQAGKAGISTVAGATGVGAAVSAVMAASTAYDVVQGAEQLNSIVGKYNATKDLPGGPQINTDGMDTVQTPTSGEGGSRSNNIGQGLDVNRTVAEQEQAYSAIDSPGLQQFARDTNLGNSTLLNVNGETGNTYLEDIESQTISPEQAVASGQVRESEINSLPTGFVKT
jgi:rhodanese-related sulfurtransferase